MKVRAKVSEGAREVVTCGGGRPRAWPMLLVLLHVLELHAWVRVRVRVRATVGRRVG